MSEVNRGLIYSDGLHPLHGPYKNIHEAVVLPKALLVFFYYKQYNIARKGSSDCV